MQKIHYIIPIWVVLCLLGTSITNWVARSEGATYETQCNYSTFGMAICAGGGIVIFIISKIIQKQKIK